MGNGISRLSDGMELFFNFYAKGGEFLSIIKLTEF